MPVAKTPVSPEAKLSAKKQALKEEGLLLLSTEIVGSVIKRHAASKDLIEAENEKDTVKAKEVLDHAAERIAFTTVVLAEKIYRQIERMSKV